MFQGKPLNAEYICHFRVQQKPEIWKNEKSAKNVLVFDYISVNLSNLRPVWKEKCANTSITWIGIDMWIYIAWFIMFISGSKHGVGKNLF